MIARMNPQLESNVEAEQLAGLAAAFAETPSADWLADVVAAGMFASYPAVRKECKARLSKHPDPRVAAFFKSEKRTYSDINAPAKMLKLVAELAELGIDPARLTLAAVRVSARRIKFVPDVLVAAALSVEGNEAATFLAMKDVEVVQLPMLKKALPAGLSALHCMRTLRVLSTSLTSPANVAELMQIPQPFELDLAVKNVKLAVFDACKTNVRKLSFIDSTSALSDVSLLRGWTKLEVLSLNGTDVVDLSPLAELPLHSLDLSRTNVTNLAPLRGMPLRALSFQFAKAPLDLAALAGHPTLTQLNLWGTKLVSAAPLAELRLEALDLSHTNVIDLAPVASIPLRSFQYIRTNAFDVVDLTPLAGHASLQTVRLDTTAVVSLAPLATLPKLTELRVNGSPRGLADFARARPEVHLIVDGRTFSPT